MIPTLRKRCSVIIGGDFNTQWESGRRGELLSEMCDAFKLRLANEEDDWTFCSCMGVKRRIDFVLCSSGLQLLDSRASYAIDLGSDHRSVVASFDLQQRRWNKTAKKKIRRGWKPAFNKNGVPQGYHEALKEQMLERHVRTLHDLEDLMLKAVAASERRSGDDSASKMCDTLRTDHELQSLLLRRRAVHCRSERASLSKLIKKMLRKHVCQKQNLKTEMILKEFQDLPFG